MVFGGEKGGLGLARVLGGVELEFFICNIRSANIPKTGFDFEAARRETVGMFVSMQCWEGGHHALGR